MAVEDILKETWFIGVVVGVGALILILIVIIITLCCLWNRRKNKQNDVEKKRESSYQETVEGQNWTLVQQNGISSAPAPNELPRYIKGDDPYIAGSSMIKMNEELKANGIHSSRTKMEEQTQSSYKTGVEKTLEENQNIDAFDRKWSTASEASRGARRGGSASSSQFERTSVVRESYQKPRITNIQISQSDQYDYNARTSYPKDRNILPERSNSIRTTHTTIYNQYNQPNQLYQIPQEDYPGIEMYNDEERYSWIEPAQSAQHNPSLRRISDIGKVKNLTEKFEAPEVNTSGATGAPTRSALENEIRDQIAARRLQQRSDAVPMSPRRISREYPGQQDYSLYQNQEGSPSGSWQKKSGKSTIENRVNRIRKVGAVSVFPE